MQKRIANERSHPTNIGDERSRRRSDGAARAGGNDDDAIRR
jgi:hypothetical protein